MSPCASGVTNRTQELNHSVWTVVELWKARLDPCFVHDIRFVLWTVCIRTSLEKSVGSDALILMSVTRTRLQSVGRWKWSVLYPHVVVVTENLILIQSACLWKDMRVWSATQFTAGEIRCLTVLSDLRVFNMLRDCLGPCFSPFLTHLGPHASTPVLSSLSVQRSCASSSTMSFENASVSVRSVIVQSCIFRHPGLCCGCHGKPQLILLLYNTSRTRAALVSEEQMMVVGTKNCWLGPDFR